MANEIEFVRECARKGFSRNHTANLLGFYAYQLDALIEVVGATDIEFVKGSQSVLAIQQRERIYESRTYEPSEGKPFGTPFGSGTAEDLEVWAKGRAKGLAAMKAKAKAEAKTYTAFGVTGTIPDLVKHFGAPVGYNSVLNRVKKGMSIEDALTVKDRHLSGGTNRSNATQYTAFGVTGTLNDLVKHFKSPVAYRSVLERVRKGMDVEKALTLKDQHLTGSPNHPSKLEIRRKAKARTEGVIARRLTPTMLQFWSSKHDIIIVKRQTPYVTVIVREKNSSDILHRLKFAAEFASGVLFMFSDQHRERMDFIAFEPDSRALI